MAKTVREMLLLRSFLKNLNISSPSSMPMHCGNQVTIFIVGNSPFHERTRHIEIDCHYIRDKVMSGVISTPHVASSYQLAEVFTKSPTRILITCIFHLKYYHIKLILMPILCNYDACCHCFLKFSPLACHFITIYIFSLFRVSYALY